MTARHLAADDGLNGDLDCVMTEVQFEALNGLGLILPCLGCTQLLEDAGEDAVVYHPHDVHDHGRSGRDVVGEIRAFLKAKKH